MFPVKSVTTSSTYADCNRSLAENVRGTSRSPNRQAHGQHGVYLATCRSVLSRIDVRLVCGWFSLSASSCVLSSLAILSGSTAMVRANHA